MRFTIHKDSDTTSEFETIYNTMQPKTHPLFTGVPAPQDVPERGIVFALVGSDYKLYTKINGALKSVTIA
jgi:hypothetical protein